MKFNKIICIIGFSCSGKSTIGPVLAERLRIPFYDLDKMIEKKTNNIIKDIFREKGERYFRKLEKDIFFDICQNRYKNKIIALGGGAFEDSAIREYIINHGISVYLQCSQRELYRRIRRHTDRPLLNVASNKSFTQAESLKNKISTLINKRIKNYKKADIIISTTEIKIKAAVNQIIDNLNIYYASN